MIYISVDSSKQQVEPFSASSVADGTKIPENKPGSKP